MSTSICPDVKPIVTVERIKSLPNICGAYVQGFGDWYVIQNIDDFQIDGYVTRIGCDERYINVYDRFLKKQ
jgi:hypothetical protein